MIPKPDGSQRELGIPTVLDRLIQQALLQVLQPLIDPTFQRAQPRVQARQTQTCDSPDCRALRPTGLAQTLLTSNS